ncbi:MAG TPA: DUF1634 domain-containing protein [Ktedonobacteraceae bacterium]|nr:DUF1634 domain-containing protein [Ktedonobacteraceae bacterium]
MAKNHRKLGIFTHHGSYAHRNGFPWHETIGRHNLHSRGANTPVSTSFNQVLGRILQIGVMVSSVIICFGLILSCVHPDQFSGQHLLRFPHTLGEVGNGLLTWQPQAFIALGLLLLIATPVIRVASSIFGFALQHDRRYVVIASLVLAILLLSFLLGKGVG